MKLTKTIKTIFVVPLQVALLPIVDLELNSLSIANLKIQSGMEGMLMFWISYNKRIMQLKFQNSGANYDDQSSTSFKFEVIQINI